MTNVMRAGCSLLAVCLAVVGWSASASPAVETPSAATAKTRTFVWTGLSTAVDPSFKKHMPAAFTLNNTTGRLDVGLTYLYSCPAGAKDATGFPGIYNFSVGPSGWKPIKDGVVFNGTFKAPIGYTAGTFTMSYSGRLMGLYPNSGSWTVRYSDTRGCKGTTTYRLAIGIGAFATIQPKSNTRVVVLNLDPKGQKVAAFAFLLTLECSDATRNQFVELKGFPVFADGRISATIFPAFGSDRLTISVSGKVNRKVGGTAQLTVKAERTISTDDGKVTCPQKQFSFLLRATQ